MKANLHIALLRGINVGGKHRLPMKDLVAIFEGAGCRNVRSYIQSGNVVFEAKPEVARAMPARVTAAVREDFGFDVPVFLRTGKELAKVVANNPFLLRGHDADILAVAFLAGVPTEERLATLESDRSPPDEFVAIGREIYLSMPNGAARSRLTNAWIDSKLRTVSTARNWRTCLQLVAMAEDG